MKIPVKYECSTSGGVAEVWPEDVKAAYEGGGIKAVADLLQEKIDNDVNRNIAAVLDDSVLDEVLELAGLGQ